jgi:hypothetical protein
MPEVQIAVGLRGKAGGDLAVVFVGSEIRFDDAGDEVATRCGFVFGHGYGFPGSMSACRRCSMVSSAVNITCQEATNMAKNHEGCQTDCG